MGRIIPYNLENKKWLKPPTRYISFIINLNLLLRVMTEIDLAFSWISRSMISFAKDATIHWRSFGISQNHGKHWKIHVGQNQYIGYIMFRQACFDVKSQDWIKLIFLYSYGPLPVISTYNPIYGMYNPMCRPAPPLQRGSKNGQRRRPLGSLFTAADGGVEDHHVGRQPSERGLPQKKKQRLGEKNVIYM